MQENSNKFSDSMTAIMIGGAITCIGIIILAYYKPALFSQDKEIIPICVILSCICAYLAYYFRGWATKCPICGKHHAMKFASKNLVSQNTAAVIKKVTKNGSTVKNLVNETTSTYHIYRECKYCGGKDYLVNIEKKTQD